MIIPFFANTHRFITPKIENIDVYIFPISVFGKKSPNPINDKVDDIKYTLSKNTHPSTCI